MEGRLINVRKLVALDVTLHGPRFIAIEFGVGTPTILAVGIWLALGSLSIEFWLGVYLILTGINYIPVLAYAVLVIRGGDWKSEVAEGLATDPHYVRKYSIQQLLIFVPFAIVVLSLLQL